ncbi:MAG: pirin family protein [Alphaproteobacteria bacterium]|jgi:redox-sensitive bicupin YhaK (pirin superfamily)|nr:pirin family protein [Alphaproteobacteria bacterium]MDG2466560.1 pirin family protein [Alphaproteobacteria bacterium]
MSIRPIKLSSQAKPHKEGAGVHLHRVFGFGETEPFDPFLMMDDFRNDDPAKYLNGFPWHPHRGIETITYVLKGNVEHGDSLGNRGVLSDGDVQWMTAGSGIIHQEMPRGNANGEMHGFQLWANLPSHQKMTTPRYQDIPSPDITTLTDDDGTHIRVIAGDYRGYRGPVDGIDTDPSYLDIAMPANTTKRFPFDTRRQGFAYIFEGTASFADASLPFGVNVEKEYMGEELKIRDQSGNRTLVVFGEGDEVVVTSGEFGVRFLLISGAPLREPVAWHGPIVMNTRDELVEAFQELNNGKFIKEGAEDWIGKTRK